jgi:hypothetical protein
MNRAPVYDPESSRTYSAFRSAVAEEEDEFIAPLIDWIEDYARAHPISFGLYALGLGFVLGWKLKPW